MSLYITYQQYEEIYNDSLDEKTFNRLSWPACKILDHMTTGVDGFCKLKKAFPVNMDSVEAIRRCVCALINFSYQVELESKAVSLSSDSNGEEHRAIASKSSGSESITYVSAGSALKNTYSAAAADDDARRTAQYNIVHEYLSGVTDFNGVNLLYLGRYPKAYNRVNSVPNPSTREVSIDGGSFKDWDKSSTITFLD